MTTNGTKLVIVVDLSALYLFAFNKAPPYIPPSVDTLTVKTTDVIIM